MEKVESIYIPMGQAEREQTERKLKKYKAVVVISGVSITLLTIYLSFLLQFVQLLKNLN